MNGDGSAVRPKIIPAHDRLCNMELPSGIYVQRLSPLSCFSCPIMLYMKDALNDIVLFVFVLACRQCCGALYILPGYPPAHNASDDNKTPHGGKANAVQ